MVAYTLKYMEMPKNCWNCKCSNFCSHFREHGCLFNGDRPSGCPLVEIGICKDCKRYNRDEMFCTWHGGYLMQKCDPNYHCADFKKRGSEDGK